MARSRGWSFIAIGSVFGAIVLGDRGFPISFCLLRTDCSQHRIANEKNVGQGRRYKHAVGVLRQPTVAHLGESEHALDDPDRMLHPGTDARLGAILRLDRIVDKVLPLALPIGEIAGLRRLRMSLSSQSSLHGPFGLDRF